MVLVFSSPGFSQTMRPNSQPNGNGYKFFYHSVFHRILRALNSRVTVTDFACAAIIPESQGQIGHFAVKSGSVAFKVTMASFLDSLKSNPAAAPHKHRPSNAHAHAPRMVCHNIDFVYSSKQKIKNKKSMPHQYHYVCYAHTYITHHGHDSWSNSDVTTNIPTHPHSLDLLSLYICIDAVASFFRFHSSKLTTIQSNSYFLVPNLFEKTTPDSVPHGRG